VKYFSIVAGIGLLIMVLALTMPWLTITFLGQFSISLADVYRLIFSAQLQTAPKGTLGDVTGFMPSITAIFITLVAYPASVILGLASMVTRKAAPFAGIVGIASGVSWIFGVNSLKVTLVQRAAESGGFGDIIAGLAATLVRVDYGAYAVIIGGIVILLAYFVKGPTSTSLTSGQPQPTAS
jgi:hypothetical protein